MFKASQQLVSSYSVGFPGTARGQFFDLICNMLTNNKQITDLVFFPKHPSKHSLPVTVIQKRVFRKSFLSKKNSLLTQITHRFITLPSS